MTTPQTPPLTDRLRERLAIQPCDSDLVQTCRTNWPDDPKSWCDGCLMQQASAAIRSAEQLKLALREALTAKKIEAYEQLDALQRENIVHDYERGRQIGRAQIASELLEVIPTSPPTDRDRKEGR